jgi:hypothetical protein
MQAALETMKWPVPKQGFCTRENGVTMGERTEWKRGTANHEHGCSLCADDAVFLFNTREDLEKGASCLYEYLVKFGLTMHIGIGATPSKTEAMFFSLPRRSSSMVQEMQSASSILRRNSNILVQSPIIL